MTAYLESETNRERYPLSIVAKVPRAHSPAARNTALISIDSTRIAVKSIFGRRCRTLVTWLFAPSCMLLQIACMFRWSLWNHVFTCSSAMAERPRELDQRFQMGGQFEAIIDREVTFRAIAIRRNLRYASYGKQTISSTRPSCWIQISTPSTDRITTPKTALAYARAVKIDKSVILSGCLSCWPLARCRRVDVC